MELKVRAAVRLARPPHHALAASHLAGLEERRGERAAAIRRLEALVARSNDPEHVGHLARLYREVGRAGEAARLREKARARFEELVRRHPAAFASHAARFWLEVMGDPARAAELAATAIVEVRSVEGVELAATAFAAAGDGARACALVEGVATGPGAPDDLRELERALCRDGADRPDQSAQ